MDLSEHFKKGQLILIDHWFYAIEVVEENVIVVTPNTDEIEVAAGLIGHEGENVKVEQFGKEEIFKFKRVKIDGTVVTLGYIPDEKEE